MAIELKSALAAGHDARGASLLLGGKEGASLGAAFDDLLANHFSGASLVIGGISGIPDPAADGSIQIAGSVASESVKKPEGDALLPPGDTLQIICRFALTSSGDDVEARLQIQLAASWKFSQSFPDLAVFDSVALVSASLTLSTGGELRFSAKAKVGGALETVSAVLGGNAEVEIAGAIRFESGVPLMALSGAIPNRLSLGPLTEMPLSLALISDEFDGAAIGYFQLRAITKLDLGSEVIEVPVLSEFQQAAGFVSFDADFSAIDGERLAAGLASMGRLLGGGDGDVAESLPESIRERIAALPFVLSSFSVGVTLSPLSVASISARFSSSRPLDLFGGVSVESFAFGAMAESLDDEANRAISAFAGGTISVSGGDPAEEIARLEVGTTIPDFGFNARLPDGSTIELKALLDHFAPEGAALPDGFPEITVTGLALSVNAAERRLFFSVVAAGDWEIIPGALTLERVSAALDVARPKGGPNSVAGSIGGTFLIGDVEAALAASFASGEGLTLSGEIPAIPLSALVEDLLGEAGLPASLPVIELRDLAATIAPAQRTFSFQGDAVIAAQAFEMFGVKIALAGEIAFRFALARGADGKTELELIASIPGGASLALSSRLAWTREIGETFRELQNDEEAEDEDPVSLTLSAPPEGAEILLLKTTLGGGAAATFLRDASDPAKSFDMRGWTLAFRFLGNELSFEMPALPGGKPPAPKNKTSAPANQKPLTLPFLKQKGDEPAAAAAADGGGSSSGKKGALGKLAQSIVVKPPSPDSIAFEGSTLSVALPATLKIGPLELDTELPMSFDLERFAFSIKHPEGVKIMSPDRELKLKKNELFGLKWDFIGAEQEDGRFHHLTLVTKSMDYQVQQAPGARIEIAYTKASKDPIVFGVSDFAITSKGLSVTAEVLDRPARLNGLDAKYTFAGSKLRIVENVVQGFTLAGSGPLPPKLVGDATANIALQFENEDGNLKLAAGSAEIKGDKLLDCKATRFQFQIDALGLKFVNDGGFHLYFTLTGSARFVLAKGDSKGGALSLLPTIQVDLNECPLTGDASTIAKHVSFLIELPKPISFPLLGAYEYELRAIGFLPNFEVFDDVAMLLSGQIKFAQGKGDVADSRPDYHKLYIGLPEKGKVFPRIYMDKIPLALSMGDAFKLDGVVEFSDNKLESGFSGEGVLAIKGLPPIAASFGFFRVRETEEQPWRRAWFIFIEARQLSFKLPVVEIFLREVGLGFGYRYTLTAIKESDKEGDIKKLIATLGELSKTQGDLAKRSAWARDLEPLGAPVPWTIVFRAMFAQTSAAPTPLTWNQIAEEKLACAFLFDAVVAFRSDLTFFMNVRAWINTNYGYFVAQREAGNQLQPLLSGFVLLSVRKKRLLAHVRSNPNGFLGNRPILPDLVQEAIRGSQFSATLLIEPGLLHFELGWPNMLRWGAKFGPLEVEQRGGFIFRVTEEDLVVGISYQARGKLEIEANVNLGLVGASLTARASVAFGARLIAAVNFATKHPVVHGAIGLDLRIAVAISLWIKIPLLFTTLKLSFRFNFELGFSAALEIGIDGTSAGIRGSGSVSVKLMGHRLAFSVRVASNEGAIDTARAKTEGYLNLGLEATEVDTSLPGVDAPQPAPSPARSLAAAPPQAAPAPAAQRSVQAEPPGAAPVSAQPAGGAPDRLVAADAPLLAPEPEPEPIPAVRVPLPQGFAAPNYAAFAIREAGDGFCYFTLVPAAEDAGGNPETGFLPPPPNPGVNPAADFALDFQGAPADGIERFQPGEGWKAVSPTERWAAHWDAALKSPVEKHADPGREAAAQEGLTLRQYLRQAFRMEAVEDAAARSAKGTPALDLFVPIGDPAPAFAREVTLEDQRVQNPGDAAFEAAVRGATEQFAGSPYFKLDPKLEYDRTLQAAFQAEESDSETESSSSSSAIKSEALQVRGLVVNDFVEDLQAFVAGGGDLASIGDSIPFQLGLVFRVPADKAPEWLRERSAAAPTIRQRTSLDGEPDESPPREIRTFNTADTDFFEVPPQFENVRHYTDAGTIAIAWKLAWDGGAAASATGARRDPEHHLRCYEVRRRELGGRGPEIVFEFKNADVIKGEGDVLRSLRPRFQLVDHFADETDADLARLPTNGRSYLYSITPVDLAGRRGRPLSLVATRFPSEPPRVPVDARMTAEYRLAAADLRVGDGHSVPDVIQPEAVAVEFSDPQEKPGAPRVAIDDYCLIFRREETLPVGSYGLDSATQRPANKQLPVSNARALPSDIRIVLDRDKDQRFTQAKVDGEDAVPLAEALRRAGVIPAGEWRPESWRVFLQSVSANGVPSALAPVELAIRATADGATGVEERQPAELEWLPQPINLGMLPAEDQRATTGVAHVPMPASGSFAGSLENIGFRRHPRELQCLRFRWNQGPSHLAEYPLPLTAGYDLLELDVDAFTAETFADPQKLAAALRPIQDIQMLPAEDLLHSPSDTMATAGWEAWYPSAVERLQSAPKNSVPGSEAVMGPWFSWRESILVWPPPDGMIAGGARVKAIHPILESTVAAFREEYRAKHGGNCLLDLQTSPPMQPGNLSAFFTATAADADPYGWSVLQRFGLSVAFCARDESDGEAIAADEVLALLHEAIGKSPSPHLFVEILFQPGRSIDLAEVAAEPSALLARVQLSLRPLNVRLLTYGRFTLAGTAGDQATVTLDGLRSASMIDLGDPGAGQTEFRGQTAQFTVRLPASGEMTFLLRGENAAGITVKASVPESQDPVSASALQAFDPTDATNGHLSQYFAQSAESLAALFTRNKQAIEAFQDFRAYAEALSSNDPEVPAAQRIAVPASGPDLEKALAEFAPWSQRFFDAAPGLAGAAPWVATAYPHAQTPAHASPDEGGRLTYHHLIRDRWAHNLRYYVRPYDRYAQLWDGLLRSSRLFGDRAGIARADEMSAAAPDPAAGALDVVIDRTQPIDPPLILSSARLDAPAPPGSPAAPGTTWEVILAQHREQSLSEKNQTIVRRLSFRQIAFTLLRRFPLHGWADLINRASAKESAEIFAEEMRDRFPDGLPGPYPEEPDHLDLAKPLAAHEALSLDLPLRVANFQQGVMALQWEGLPFYYEHRLIAIAQSASTVSPPNSVVQKDFEYITPAVAAFAEGRPDQRREITIPLRRLWDALPPAAQERWPDEAPDSISGEGGVKPGALPDLEVVYQLVAVEDGNIEVQAEIFFDFSLNAYAVRQPGKRFVVQGAVTVERTNDPLVTHQLRFAVSEFTTIPFPFKTPDRAGPATFDREARTMTLDGALTRPDLALLERSREGETGPSEQLRALFRSWTNVQDIAPLASLPKESLADIARYELAWSGGSLTPEAEAALSGLQGDAEFRAAAAKLIARIRALGENAAGGEIAVRAAAPPVDNADLPAELPDGLSLRITAVRYHGIMSAAEARVIAGEIGDDAARELYAKSVAGRPGSSLQLSARRGSAAPRPMIPLTPLPMSGKEDQP